MLKRLALTSIGLVFLAAPLFASADSTCPTLSHTLARGSRGNDVVQLQQFLIAQGSLQSGLATGYFGVLTEASVRSWQSKNGVDAVGIVGPKTRATIAKMCNTKQSTPGKQSTDTKTPTIAKVPRPLLQKFDTMKNATVKECSRTGGYSTLYVLTGELNGVRTVIPYSFGSDSSAVDASYEDFLSKDCSFTNIDIAQIVRPREVQIPSAVLSYYNAISKELWGRSIDVCEKGNKVVYKVEAGGGYTSEHTYFTSEGTRLGSNNYLDAYAPGDGPTIGFNDSGYLCDLLLRAPKQTDVQ